MSRWAPPDRYRGAAVSTAPEPYDPQRCTACRGTGQVISGLGGTPQKVTCPWCEGTGRYMPGHDAQTARREAD
jgi:DnaJ-class molecular chaperone